MKILIVANHRTGTKGNYIGKAFERLGHQTEFFDDWNYGLSDKNILDRFRRFVVPRLPILEKLFIRYISDPRFLLAVSQFNPDLIFLSRSDRISKEVLSKVKQTAKALVIHWFPDGAKHPAFDSLLPTLPILDMLFVKDSFAVQLLEQKGYDRVQFLPQCCSIDMHRTIKLSSEEQIFYGSDIALASSITPQRLELLNELTDFDLKIWCDLPWLYLKSHPKLLSKVTNQRAFGKEQSMVFNAAKIVLNLHRNTDVHGLNLRTFEVAGCGGFQFINRKEDLVHSFEDEKEIVCFDSMENLRNLASYYLRHEKERRRIAENAQRRVHAEHTYENRISKIMNLIDM